MLDTFTLYIVLIIIILVLVMVANKLKIAYPIVLVIGGLGISWLPWIPPVNINPELIFLIFLPPLLFEAAWNASWKDIWRWRRVIGSFAFLIVVLTSFVIALISSAIIPGFTLALGFLLGGIVSPPDAVSAGAVLKYVKVPKRFSAIIEGESLLNDASSLIVFRFALIAVSTGRFVFYEATFSFFAVIIMGILIGVAIGLVYYAFSKWLPTTTNMDIVLTLSAPYIMYILAESMHFSGVLSVVSGGLFLSARRHDFLSHRSRLRGGNVWSTLGFVLNGLVFMLIGLELPDIVRQLGPVNMSHAVLYGLIISAVLIITRMLSTIGASYFTVFISRYITTADNRPGLRGPIILGWAGMRGVVSLAAALSIPITLSDGTPFPNRNLILFITFTVILITLVVQGLTLPWVIKRVNMEDRDHMPPDEEQDLMINQKLAAHSLEFLTGENKALLKSNKGLQQLKLRFENEQLHHEIALDEDQKSYREVYLKLISEQRKLLVELNKSFQMNEEVIRRHQGMLDLEEEKLRLRFDGDAE